MRAVVQRVLQASVAVDVEVVAEIGPGVVVLLGVAKDDTVAGAGRLAERVARMRIFENDESRLELSLLDRAGEALVVSQFTLIADTRRRNRPSFTAAAPSALAAPLYSHFCEALEGAGVRVLRGVFGARMQIALVLDGPVTIVLDA